jgi:formylglycine-generating enzyme required for sulfatase activity
MGLGGNVFEWEETENDLVNNSPSSARGVRGGGWSSSSDILSASVRVSFNPSNGVSALVFVSQVSLSQVQQCC